jgi:hypothetical protein
MVYVLRMTSLQELGLRSSYRSSALSCWLPWYVVTSREGQNRASSFCQFDRVEAEVRLLGASLPFAIAGAMPQPTKEGDGLDGLTYSSSCVGEMQLDIVSKDIQYCTSNILGNNNTSRT